MPHLVYITVSSMDEARKIARAVVDERLAACANIIPGMTSIYRWQDKVEEGAETVLILKTRAGLFEAVEKRVKELHSYATPCILSVAVAECHAPFAEWIYAETKI